jgi:predicted AAA+ superfamily ATPase
VLEAARGDPSGYVRGLDQAIVDEVQRAPDLLRATKKTIDVDRCPGRFRLTGSATVLTLPQVFDSLAGRMQVVNHLPLSRAEIGEAYIVAESDGRQSRQNNRVLDWR